MAGACAGFGFKCRDEGEGIHAGQAGESVEQFVGPGRVNRNQQGLAVGLFQPPHPPAAQGKQAQFGQLGDRDIAAGLGAEIADLPFIDLDENRYVADYAELDARAG